MQKRNNDTKETQITTQALTVLLCCLMLYHEDECDFIDVTGFTSHVNWLVYFNFSQFRRPELLRAED